MRPRLLLPALLLLALFAMPLAAANLDLVVMVDTSTSMFPYFDDLIHYLVQDLLKERLHTGDSFHLLSFSSTPEEELSVEIGSQQDVEKAFGRILLLQPLGRYTDLIAALRFLYRYVRELPETNPKTVLLLTDGVHDPPPGSPNRGDPGKIAAAIQDVAAQIEKQGWAFHIVKVPPEPVPGEEGLRSYLPDLAQALHTPIVPFKTQDRTTITGQTTGFPTLSFPPNLGRVGTRFTAPFRVTNYRSDPIIVRLVGVESDGSQLLERKLTVTVPPRQEAALNVPLRLPAGLAGGEQTMSLRLTFEDDLRISPTEGDITFTLAGGGLVLPRVNLLFVLYIVLAAVVVFLLVLLFLFMRRKLREVSVSGVEKAVAGEQKKPAAVGRRSTAEAPPATVAEKRPAEGPPAAAPAARAGAPSVAPAPAPTGPAAPAPGVEHALRRPGRGHRKLIPLMDSTHAGPAPVGPAPVHPAARPHTAESLRSSLPSAAASPALPPQIEMRVSGQNSHIGFRNIHRLTGGSSRSIGGRFSGFLIFLVPMPRGIAEIRNESGRYALVPLRPEFFPSLSGPLQDCLDLEIPVATPQGFSCTIRFHRWVSPLEEINALMRSAAS
jgi:Mg-chelatase subunit ChlD